MFCNKFRANFMKLLTLLATKFVHDYSFVILLLFAYFFFEEKGKKQKEMVW